MRLSPHFDLAEFVQSSAADRLGVDNTPPVDLVCAMQILCMAVLEPLRARVGPLRISSGYRCPAVNAAVGSTSASQHLIGEAADVVARSASKAATLDALWELALCGAPIDQVIVYSTTDHLHVSCTSRREARHQFLAHDANCYRAIVRGEIIGPSAV